ncbi:MAG: mannose-1-phosphate guanylyltransferase [Bdellovibrionota bacterium]
MAFDPNLHILIMAGGSGTRFWPRSRAQRPKQLLALWDDKTLLQHTVDRFAQIVPLENIWIVTNKNLVEPSQRTLGERYRDVHYLGEPVGKNTAPCILWGIHEIYKVQPQAVVGVMSADSYIGDEDAFRSSLEVAVKKAKEAQSLVTLGVKPNRPETGYGYIEVERATRNTGPLASPALPVRRFVEKPILRTAVSYLESGNYLWNAGMFIFEVQAGLSAFRKTMPGLAGLFEGALHVEKIYPEIRKEDAVSVDYGVMERALDSGIPVYVVPTDCGWNDVGSFTALEEINCSTLGEVVSLDAACNVVQTDSGMVALLGVNDLVVVRDGDVVLVASKDRAQDIKLLVEKVRLTRPEKV